MSQIFSSPTLTAVLFVGGESRRMGADKATLMVHGEPQWLRQMKVLRELQPEKILVSARTKPAWCPPEIEVVFDEPPSRGPLSGLAAALEKIRTTHLLALAVDLPRMNAAHLKKILACATADCGVVPVIGGRFEALCAIYPGGEFASGAARRALATGNFSLQNFIANLAAAVRVQVLEIQPGEQTFYFNANTPQDFSPACS
jgi:molybdopterin-guanine dinucleotide biosynthesis protein A